jgi:hypothetical protein
VTTMSSGNAEQEPDVRLTSKNLRLESRNCLEIGHSFVHANVGQNSLLLSAGFRETDPQPLAIDNASIFISAYDEIIERPPSICMSTKAVAGLYPALTCPRNFMGTLSEESTAWGYNHYAHGSPKGGSFTASWQRGSSYILVNSFSSSKYSSLNSGHKT